MSAPRHVNPVGDKPEEYDDRPRGGIFHRADRGFRKHPWDANHRICEICWCTVLKGETPKHAEMHRIEAAWEDKVELLEEQLAEQRREMDKIQGEWHTLTDILGPSLARLMAYEAAIQERE